MDESRNESVPLDAQHLPGEVTELGGAALGTDEASRIEAERGANEHRWESEVGKANDDRSLIKRKLGLGEVSAGEVMRDEAAEDDELFNRIPERNRPGSSYIELPPDKVEAVQELMDKLWQEIKVLDEASKISAGQSEDAYRAPELLSAHDKSMSQRFAIFMLRKLAQNGKLNFWDASVDISNAAFRGRKFSDEDQSDYINASERVQKELGIKYKIVPESGPSNPDDLAQATAEAADEIPAEKMESEVTAPILEYDLEDLNGNNLGSKEVNLPENLEEAKKAALQFVVDQEMNPATANTMVRNPKVRMPDGTVVSWHDFTAPPAPVK